MPAPLPVEVPDRRLTPTVRGLVAAGLAVAFLQLTLVREPNPLEWLGFSLRTFEGRWWTPFTYAIVHDGLWPLALNVAALMTFGPRLEREWSSGELLRYVLLCALGGVLLQVLFFRDSLLVGGSAAAFGVMLAYTRRWPDDVIYLFHLVPVRARWLAVSIGAMSLVGGLGSTTTFADSPPAGGVAFLAHLGGVVAGWLYLRLFAVSDGERLRPHIAALPDVPDETPRAVPRGSARPRERREEEVDEIVAQSKAALASKPTPAQAAPRPAEGPPRPLDLDRVLDKISRDGLESLSGAERKLLEEASRRLREGE